MNPELRLAPSADPDSLPRLDARTIDRLRQIGEKTGRNSLRELGDGFLGRLPQLLDEIRRALDGDAEKTAGPALIHPIHTLAGMAGSLGALRLSEICRRFENAARDHRTVEFKSRFRDLLEEARLVEEEMRLTLAGQHPTP